MEKGLIGDRIRELRKNKDLTQDELAALMNVSRVQINQWETGARELSVSRISEFANALGTTCEYLIRGIEIEKFDSFNQTGLKNDALNALDDLKMLPETKRDQYLSLINDLLGSDYFWTEVMMHLTSALSIAQNSALGGSYRSVNQFTAADLSEKLYSCSDFIKTCNAAGYVDELLISKETAISYHIQEAADAFKNLAKATIDEKLQNFNKESITAPYRRKNSSNDSISYHDFVQFMKSVGIHFNEE